MKDRPDITLKMFCILWLIIAILTLTYCNANAQAKGTLMGTVPILFWEFIEKDGQKNLARNLGRLYLYENQNTCDTAQPTSYISQDLKSVYIYVECIKLKM